ncbi:MAG: sigma-E processing peptidase SpoIIGA [Bacillota bacterium]
MLVYIEVVILDNLIIDYIILYLCGMQEKRKLKFWRGLLASVIGVLIAIVATLDIPNFAMLLLKISVSVGMTLVAFGKEKFKRTLLNFYLFTFTIGGGAMGLLYLKQSVASGVLQTVASVPTGIIFGVIFAGYIFAKRCIYIFSANGVKNEYTYTIEMCNECTSLLTSAFLDSGNLLVFGDDLRGVLVGEYVNFASFFKGEKPRGQVGIDTASGGDFLYVYNVESVKVYKINENVNSENKKGENAEKGELILCEKDVAFALSRCRFNGDFKVLLSPMLF